MNKFKVGDRVRCVQDSRSPSGFKIGEEFIITCVNQFMVGFVSRYPLNENEYYNKVRKGTDPFWNDSSFTLIEAVEDMSFNKQMKEITDEPI